MCVSQTLFGLMQADPTDLGYLPIEVPGFTVGELLGVGAFSTVFKAEKSEDTVDSGTADSDEAEVPDLQRLPVGLREHVVLGDGVAPYPFIRIMFLPVTDSFHGIFSFVFASGCARKAQPGGCILPQYVHGSVPKGGELTGVVL